MPAIAEHYAAAAGPAPDAADFLCVCIRVPKSGSESLTALVREGFQGRRIFYLPTTWHRDSAHSAFQRYRGFRSRAQNLFKHYRTISLDRACEVIARNAADGDVIDGGHIDFRTVAGKIARKLKMITILREPEARILSDYNYARQGYLRKPLLNRFDAGVLHKAAARYDFEDYLDFLLDHRHLYGNWASVQIGWDGKTDLRNYFRRHMFHAGVLEQRDRFAAELSEKLGRPLSFPHENRTQAVKQKSVSAKARAKIAQLYDRDMQLYAWVRDNL